MPASGHADVLVPDGFTVRMVARSGHYPAGNRTYRWHAAPDGGATVATDDGGWIYVSNSELSTGRGGTGALRFSPHGDVVDAYSILHGTSRNCAGAMMPWGSYLSCEEHDRGRIWECDPFGAKPARVRPALGVFSHEDVALDPASQQLYLTEDKPDGRLYRFTPSRLTQRGDADLEDGRLEVARRMQHDGREVLDWLPLPDVGARHRPTRLQVADSSPFNGAEGIACVDGAVYFVTKGDDRVWRYSMTDQALDIFYDAGRYAAPLLTGVDNLAVAGDGTVYVAEDGGNMQIIRLDRKGNPQVVVQLLDQDNSEMTGIAFSPDFTRLYFSSQRGKSGHGGDGMTYEVSGPFQEIR